jgi:glycosyltransferase involved in cell wall biosynthesis
MAYKILWIAPNLNHYKVRQLNKLSEQVEGLKVLHGSPNESDGHKMSEKTKFHFDRAQVNCSKKDFSRKIAVYRHIWRELRNNRFKIVLMPMEKKHFSIILYLYMLKHIFKFRFVSYNHHYFQKKPKQRKLLSFFDRQTVHFMTGLYDTIIYYTERGMKVSVEERMVAEKKAFFANNTIDVEHIFNVAAQNEIQPDNNILFIGRILPSKRVDILLDYFQEIKKSIRDCKLFIIGEGPELAKYRTISEGVGDIYWLDGIVEEEVICKYAQMSKIVFVPGHSGLSINHSFAYRKPYVTLERKTHPPEIDYLRNGENGLILPANDKENNIKKILRLLIDDTYYSKMSEAAYETAKKLTLENWVNNMRNALKV